MSKIEETVRGREGTTDFVSDKETSHSATAPAKLMTVTVPSNVKDSGRVHFGAGMMRF